MQSGRSMKENGYTLAEVLVVLTIVMIMTTFTVVSFKPLIRHLEIDYFFKQLQLDVSYTQMYAMSNHSNIQIIFYPERYRYVVSQDQKTILLRRNYSSSIDVQLITLPATVMFYANGTIKKAGKMYVRYNGSLYSFVFLFGKGQTYVEKL